MNPYRRENISSDMVYAYVHKFHNCHFCLFSALHFALELQRQECQFFDVVKKLRCVPWGIPGSAGSYQECISDNLRGLCSQNIATGSQNIEP